jgi:hypothetical protein
LRFCSSSTAVVERYCDLIFIARETCQALAWVCEMIEVVELGEGAIVVEETGGNARGEVGTMKVEKRLAKVINRVRRRRKGQSRRREVERDDGKSNEPP